MENIKWRPLYFNDEYEVSEFGQVRNTLTNRILKGSLNSYGYRYYYLQTPGSTGKWYYAHRLVILSDNLSYFAVSHDPIALLFVS